VMAQQQPVLATAATLEPVIARLDRATQ